MEHQIDRVSRKDVIHMMVGKSLSVSTLARMLGVKRSEVHEELRHVLMSLKHMDLRVEIQPARCRKCGFIFGENELRKPSRCPECRSTWIADPIVSVKAPQEETERPGESQTGEAELEICDGVKLMDHAADAGLIITARTMRELFERAAMGMFLLLMDLSAVRPVQSESIRLTAEDAEILLVSWLSELNYRHVVRRMVYCRFHVSELDGVKLAATVSGEKLDRARHTIHTEIKAITRHGLKIVTTDKGYRAEVLFDL